MKVDKVLTRFASAPEDEQELRRVARALGDELPRQRLEVLQKFRAGLARIAAPEGSFAAGYMASMLDVSAEYEVFVRQHADDQELVRTAMREDWRAVLGELAAGPRLPSELAASLGKDRPSITRILKRLRAAGLIQAYTSNSLDGRRRPHRLTVQGKRLLDGLSARSDRVSGDVERGISIAVGLFRHLISHASSPAPALGAVAAEILEDPAEAARAVDLWVQHAKSAGLISETGAQAEAQAAARSLVQGGREGQPRWEPAPPFPPTIADDASWTRIPSILTELKRRKEEHVPVYVRTNDEAWGAWAYALKNDDTTGMSRTIVKGDILARSVAPPGRRFDLIYDDPRAIQADRHEPTMQAFWRQADEKFVVTTAEDDVPEGFIQLNVVAPKKD